MSSEVLDLIIEANRASARLYGEIITVQSRRRAIRSLKSDLDTSMALLENLRGRVEQHTGDSSVLQSFSQPLRFFKGVCEAMSTCLQVCLWDGPDRRLGITKWTQMQYHGKSFGILQMHLDVYSSALFVISDCIFRAAGSFQDLEESILDVVEDAADQIKQARERVTFGDVSLQKHLRQDVIRLEECLDCIAAAQRQARRNKGEATTPITRANDTKHKPSRSLNLQFMPSPSAKLSAAGPEPPFDAEGSFAAISEIPELPSFLPRRSTVRDSWEQTLDISWRTGDDSKFSRGQINVDGQKPHSRSTKLGAEWESDPLNPPTNVW